MSELALVWPLYQVTAGSMRVVPQDPTGSSSRGATAMPVVTDFSAALRQACGSSRRSRADVSRNPDSSSSLAAGKQTGHNLHAGKLRWQVCAQG